MHTKAFSQTLYQCFIASLSSDIIVLYISSRDLRSQIALDCGQIILRETQLLRHVSIKAAELPFERLSKLEPVLRSKIHKVDEPGCLDIVDTNGSHGELDELVAGWFCTDAGQEVVVHNVVRRRTSKCLQNTSDDTSAVAAS